MTAAPIDVDLTPASAIAQPKPLGWAGIVRLGLVQSALGAIVALTTSTLNRVMAIEMAMPVLVPAALVAWHYAVQLSRPHWGHGSDRGARRTPWIVAGMGVLALGAILATDATLMMKSNPAGGVAMAVVAYLMIGAGVGASGTSLLALMAARVAPTRRPAAASLTWILMIVGIVISSATVGHLIEPFSAQRLALVASGVALIAFLVTLGAVAGIEPQGFVARDHDARPALPFRAALSEIWANATDRRFTIFIFVSMLAYSAQDLILEPFAGLVFGFSPGQSTQLSSVQHGGVLAGMILVGAVGARLGGAGWMRRWTVLGCLGSAAALTMLVIAASVGRDWPLAPTVFGLGFFNGVFAVAAIGSMMGLAGAGAPGREGIRIGLWGAAQAIAFGLGGLSGAAGVDVLRAISATAAPGAAFAPVFAAEACLFLISAWLAAQIAAPAKATMPRAAAA
jgi:BCD family chlorophyll transporter-like MFS transporter